MNAVLSLQETTEDTRPEDAPWSSFSFFNCS
ncbi:MULTISPECIES: class III lanthipeptide [Winogradskya]|nr:MULTISPECIES: class III lanthipeptide [Actinoplanes]